MNWLRQTPTLPLAVIAIVLALAPLQPEPHLWAKLRMLVAGAPLRWVDWVDIALHGTPLALLVYKLTVLRGEKAPQDSER